MLVVETIAKIRRDHLVEGKPYAELALRRDQLLVLHHRPQQAA